MGFLDDALAKILGPQKAAKLKPASWRGVSFHAEEVGFDTGRRIIEYEYPQRDEPNTDDQGRAIRHWSLRAFLVGAEADVLRSKRQLIAACEKAGPGTLVHPTEGKLTARCKSLNIVETSAGTNYVEVQINFVERGTTLPAAAPAKAAAASFGASLRAAVRTFYKARVAIRSINSKVNRMLSGSIEDRMAAMLELTGQLTGEDTSDFVYAVRVGADTSEALASDSDELLDTWELATGSLSEPGDARLVAASMAALVAETQGTTPPITDTDGAIDANAKLLDLAMYCIAASYAAELTAGQTFESYDEAQATAGVLFDQMSGVGLDVADGDTQVALGELAASMSSAVIEDAMQLPRVRNLILPGTHSALALAYALYGDARRMDEIVERNGLADPNAVTGTIQVLTE